MRRPPTTFGLVMVLLLVTVAACTSGDGDAGGEVDATSSTTTTSPAPPAPAVIVTARDYSLEIPAIVQGGVIRLTLRNIGSVKHEAVIVATGETPIDRLKQDLTPIASGAGAATPAYMRFLGGVSLVPGGTAAESTLALPVGRYAVVCTLTDADSLDSDKAAQGAAPPARSEQLHFDRGMAARFQVETTNNAVMPSTNGTVVARDWAFDVPSVTPGSRTFAFRNDGQQDHSVAVAQFAAGVEPAAAQAAYERLLAATPDNPPPDALPTPDDVAFAGPLSAGAQGTFAVELKPNRTYVFACFMSDREGGPLHAVAKRMVAFATTPPG